MRLAFSNAAFTHEGVKMPEVPVILNDDMSIVETPQRWLFNIALDRGRTRSPATWRSYAEALYDWLQTCQANGWTWNEVDEGHLRAYRNQMLYHPSSVTGRAYSRRTINGRLRRLAMFYTWAFRRELIDKLPFEYETVRAPITPDARLLARRLVTGDAYDSAFDGSLSLHFDPISLSTRHVRTIEPFGDDTLESCGGQPSFGDLNVGRMRHQLQTRVLAVQQALERSASLDVRQYRKILLGQYEHVEHQQNGRTLDDGVADEFPRALVGAEGRRSRPGQPRPR